MGRFKGLIGGLAGLLAVWLSMHVLSAALTKLPWTRMAAPRQTPRAIPAIRQTVSAPERALLPAKRSVAGSVPLYRESRPEPVRAPEPERKAEAPPPRRQAPARPMPSPPPASAQAPRLKLETLPALGESFGAPAQAPGPGPAPAAGAPSRSSGYQPAGSPEVIEAPPQGMWDGDYEPVQPPPQPKARRPMRALPQAGVVLPAQPAPEQYEEELEPE